MTRICQVLEAHTDEVWNLAWSHDGQYLASAGKDRRVIIWRIDDEPDDTLTTSPSTPQVNFVVQHILHEHRDPVGCVAWAPDGNILLSASETHVYAWDTKTGARICTLEEHSLTITSIQFLPDGTGFITGGLDRCIIFWNRDWTVRTKLELQPIRITGLAVTPDGSRLVVIGVQYIVPQARRRTTSYDTQDGTRTTATVQYTEREITTRHRIVVYDLASMDTQRTIDSDVHMTSICISDCSQFALVNYSEAGSTESSSGNHVHDHGVIVLRDLNTGRKIHSYGGHRQRFYVIRSCFGGANENLIISGSEDHKLYIWDRETEELLETLVGHGPGSVNAVACNPVNRNMIASCSDDCTLRIWDISPR